MGENYVFRVQIVGADAADSGGLLNMAYRAGDTKVVIDSAIFIVGKRSLSILYLTMSSITVPKIF